MSRFHVEVTDLDDLGVCLSLMGELDITGAEKLKSEQNRLENGAPATVIVDLRGLQFMDSSGLRWILRARERIHELGGKFVLVRGPEAIQRLFSVTELDKRLEFIDDPASIGAEGP